MKFYSEFGEDAWIAENVTLPERGVYLDIGAAHPTIGSNTAFLRDRGWDGLAVDASPAYAEFWKTPFIVGVVSRSPVVPFAFCDDPGLSRVSNVGHQQFAVSLDHICDQVLAASPDFLSLDIEGHEYSALLSLDLTKRRPLVIVSEYNTAGLGEDHRVKHYLKSLGYRAAHQTASNHVFVRD